MNERMLQILEGDESKYPHVLEARFKRVFDRIVAFWGTEELDPLFSDLCIDDRGGRQGFPPDAMGELFVLFNVNERQKSNRAGAWDLEAVKRGLAQERIDFSEAGFFRSVKQDNDKAVGLFLQAGYDVNQKNDVGWTPLMVAAFFGNERIAATLIESGARVSAQDNQGYTPLHWSALQGYAKVADLLLRKGAFVNARSKRGITPLIQAAAKGYPGIVKLLLVAGAHVNRADDEGWTPLHKAVSNGHVDVVKLLLGNGADKDARHVKGTSPRDIAKRKDNPEIQVLF